MNYVIMLNEIIKHLNIKPDGIYMDCTFGIGGHSNEIIKYLNFNGKIITTDKEIDSYFLAKDLYKKNKKIHPFLISFNKIDIILNKFKKKIDGIIADLGLSIYQLNSSIKGFSSNKNCFLDMRLDIRNKLRVIDWINIASEKELENIFYFFYDKKTVKDIIKNIIKERNKNKIKTNKDLINTMFSKNNFSKEKNVINRLFLFIKIFINNDFNSLNIFLEKCLELLKKNGKLIIVSFNSTEDAVIKKILNNSKIKQKITIIKPSILDIDKNYATRSAFMRIITKK